MPPGQNDIGMKLTGDASDLEQKINKIGAMLNDLKQQAANINLGGSAPAGSGGRAASASSAAGVAQASTAQGNMNPGRGAGPAPQPARTGQRISGAAMQAGATAFQAPTAAPRVLAPQVQPAASMPTMMMPTMAMPAGSIPGQAPGVAAYMHWAASQNQAAQAVGVASPGWGAGGAWAPGPGMPGGPGGPPFIPPATGGFGGGGFVPGAGGYRGMVNQQGGLRMRLQGDAAAFLELEAASGASRMAGQYFSYRANRLLNPGDDPIARTRMITGGISSAVGIAAGVLTRSPQIGMITGGLVESVIGPLGDFIAAPEANRQGADASMMPYFSATRGRGAMNAAAWYTQSSLDFPDGPGARAATYRQSRLESVRDYVNSRLTAGLQTTVETGGATLGGVYSAMFQAGKQPEAPGEMFGGGRARPLNNTGPSVIYPDGGRSPGATSWRRDLRWAEDIDSIRGRDTGGTFEGMIRRTIGVIKAREEDIPGFQETIGETYKRRLELMTGKDSVDAIKRIAPMFSREYGEGAGNQADLLAKFGPANAALYSRMLNKDMQSAVDPMVLSAAFGDLQAHQRQRTLGSLQVRGRGEAATAAALADMSTIAKLPEGRDSVAYAEANAARRAGLQQMFHERDTMQFGIPRDALEARRDIARELPYQPGYGMRFAMESLQMRQGEIGEKTDRFRKLMQMGDLSEDQERAYRKDLLDLKVSQAHDIGTLAEGGPNRIRAMMAGGPSRRGRYDSMTMAQTALWRSGHPRQDYGFANGAHMAQSDNWFGQFGVNVDPISRTGELNAGWRARGQYGPGAGSGRGGGASGGVEETVAWMPSAADWKEYQRTGRHPWESGHGAGNISGGGGGVTRVSSPTTDTLLTEILNEIKHANHGGSTVAYHGSDHSAASVAGRSTASSGGGGASGGGGRISGYASYPSPTGRHVTSPVGRAPAATGPFVNRKGTHDDYHSRYEGEVKPDNFMNRRGNHDDYTSIYDGMNDPGARVGPHDKGFHSKYEGRSDNDNFMNRKGTHDDYRSIYDGTPNSRTDPPVREFRSIYDGTPDAAPGVSRAHSHVTNTLLAQLVNEVKRSNTGGGMGNPGGGNQVSASRGNLADVLATRGRDPRSRYSTMG